MARRQQRIQHIVKGYIQTEPNKWYRLDSPEITECCDCGLVHHTEYMFEKGRMFWRSKVDTKATLAAREAHGIFVTREPPQSLLETTKE